MARAIERVIDYANGACEKCGAHLPDQRRKTCTTCHKVQKATRNSIEPVPLSDSQFTTRAVVTASYRECAAFQGMKAALLERGIDVDEDRALAMAMNEWVISVFLRAREDARSHT